MNATKTFQMGKFSLKKAELDLWLLCKELVRWAKLLVT